MRKRLVIGLLVMLAIIAAPPPIPTTAQAEAMWYWATTPDGLVAYTIDRDSQLLVEDPTLHSATTLFGYRIAPNAALFRTDTDFYWVTENAADVFPIDPYILENYLRPINFAWPYVLLMETETIRPGAVLNLDTKAVSVLTGDLLNSPRFLPDGQTLRYVGYEDWLSNERKATLWERDLVTGTETALISGRVDAVHSSPDGLMWWWLTGYDHTTGRFADGQVIGDVSTLPPEHLDWLVEGDAAVIGECLHHNADPDCLADCLATAYPLAGGPPIEYRMPENIHPLYFQPLADESVLMTKHTTTNNRTSLALLEPDGMKLELGQVDNFDIPASIGLPPFSPDGLWAVSMVIKEAAQIDQDLWLSPFSYTVSSSETGQPSLLLWYLPYRGIVYKGSFQRSAGAAFDGDTALTFNDLLYPALAWRTDLYAETVVKTIVLDDYAGQFYAPISGGRAIYRSPEGNLMLFSMQDMSLRLLVPQAKPIPTYE